MVLSVHPASLEHPTSESILSFVKLSLAQVSAIPNMPSLLNSGPRSNLLTRGYHFTRLTLLNRIFLSPQTVCSLRNIINHNSEDSFAINLSRILHCP